MKSTSVTSVRSFVRNTNCILCLVLYEEEVTMTKDSLAEIMRLASNTTTEQLLSYMSETSFRNRMPVVIYLVVLIVVGFFGNMLVLVVYVVRIRRDTTPVFIITMAVFDLLTSVLGLPLQLATIRHAYDTNDLWFCRGMFASATLPTQASGMILVVIALHRYQRIRVSGRCPNSRRLHVRGAWGVVFLSSALALLLFGPFIPLYGIHSVRVGRVTAHMCWVDNRYVDTTYETVFFRGVLPVVFFASLAAMTFSYCAIGHAIWTRIRPGSGQIGKSLTESTTPAVAPASDLLRGRRSSAASGRERLARPNADECRRLSGNLRERRRLTRARSEPFLNQYLPQLPTITERTEITRSSNGTTSSGVPSRPELIVKKVLTEAHDTHRTRSSIAATTSTGLRVPRSLGMQLLTSLADELKKTKLHPKHEDSVKTSGAEQGQISSSSGTARGSQAEEESEETRGRKVRCKSLPSISDFEYTNHVCGAMSGSTPLVHRPRRRIHHRTTRVMLVLTLLYVVNWLPHLIVRLLGSMQPVNWCENFVDCGWNIRALSLRSYYLSSAVNAFVYSFLNPKFRYECWAMFSRIHQRSRGISLRSHKAQTPSVLRPGGITS